MYGPRLKAGAIILLEDFCFDAFSELKMTSGADSRLVVEPDCPRRTELKEWGARMKAAHFAALKKASAVTAAPGDSSAGPSSEGLEDTEGQDSS